MWTGLNVIRSGLAFAQTADLSLIDQDSIGTRLVPPWSLAPRNLDPTVVAVSGCLTAHAYTPRFSSRADVTIQAVRGYGFRPVVELQPLALVKGEAPG